MMRSLYSGVAGLRTHQTKMDVLGNNIANVNTTSYKSQSITFSDLMYQTTQTASGASETKGGVNARQIGLGAKSGAISTAIESQGATQTTNNPFDIMITGSSFFIVNNGKENLYTRDGSFYVDGAGNLAMQSNGYFVQGWAAKEDKKTGEIQVDKNGDITSLQIMSADNATYSPASTTQALYSGNIDDHDTNVTSDDGKTITLEFYDNKGYLYTGKFTLKDTGTDHLFSLQLTDILDSDGNSINQEITLPDGSKTNRLDHVTFGETETVTSKIDDGYFIDDPVNDKTTIWRNANSPVYSEYTINASGQSLDSLMKIDGFLDEVYKLKDGKTYKEKYGDILGYEISNDAIEITYKSEDAKLSIDPSKTYSALDTSDAIPPYYYNRTNHFGYALPNADGNQYKLNGKLIDLNAGLVQDVFKVPTTDVDPTKYADYAYSYDVDAKSLTIIADKGPNPTSSSIDANALNTTYDAYFEGAKGYSISDLVSGANDGTITSSVGTSYKKPVTYTYEDGVLKISGKYMKPGTTGTGDIGVSAEVAPNLYTRLKDKMMNVDFPLTTDKLSSDGIAQLKNLMEVDDLTDYTFSYKLTSMEPLNYELTYTKDGVSVTKDVTVTEDKLLGDLSKISQTVNIADLSEEEKAEIYSQLGLDSTDITSAEFTYSEKTLTGTTGFTCKVNYSGSVEETEVIDTFNHVSFTPYYADATVYDYEEAPTSVYRNKGAKNEGYVLVGGGSDGTYTLDQLKNQISEDVIKDIYKDFTSYDDLKNGFDLSDDQFTVQLNASRMLVTHIQLDTNDINPDYEATKDITTNTVKYKTVNPTAIATDIPVSGKISDLLSSASGDYKGVLQKIFGISDDDARAYGSDGTYKIGEDLKSVELTTGTHTVMLKFDAANGSLVSANDNKLGKGLVNMVFDQSELYGMEAFGYQKGDNDPAEMVAGHMTFDFSSVTNYNTSGSSTVKAVKGDKKSLNTGRAVGEMNGVNISTDGRIYATYSNGQTKLLGQIASAQFANASGLSKEGDNLYSSTLNSGEATVQDITTDGGYMNTGVLEMSNVDLSREFTEMITTQRGFQANSRIITVSDTLLEELTNLKR